MRNIEIALIGSFPKVKFCPKKVLPEFAFIGRSNVGKSSLINYLTNRKKLSRVSASPGKTRLINLFEAENWILADLPGYGYAKVSKSKRAEFDTMIKNYLLYRENLKNVFVLIDSHIPPQKIDLEFIQWMGENGIPFTIVFTKIDKQSRNKTHSNILKYKKILLNTWEVLPEMINSSSTTSIGRDEILKTINNIITIN